MYKLFSVLLIVVILITIAGIVWLAVVPEKGDRFTEFYILGLDGKADNYPRTVTAGNSGAVIVGIVNRENKEVQYRLLVKTGDVVINKIETISLANKQKWENSVSFILTKVGDNQKVEFLLYKDEGADPYLSLNLRINVK